LELRVWTARARTLSRPVLMSAAVRCAGMSGWMPMPTNSVRSAKLSCLVQMRALPPPGRLNRRG